MRRYTAYVVSVVLLTSGCSYININSVPSTPPIAESERAVYETRCTENRESVSPRTDLIATSVGLIIAGVAFGLGAACEVPPDAEWGEGYDCLSYIFPTGIGALITLMYGPSAIYGTVNKSRCSE
jgi:hypothetical protein